MAVKRNYGFAAVSGQEHLRRSFHEIVGEAFEEAWEHGVNQWDEHVLEMRQHNVRRPALRCEVLA